jgi:Phage-related protein, tail component
MSGDAVKAAVVVGAIATGGFALGLTGGLAFGGQATLLSTFVISAGSSLVLSTVNQKLAPKIDIPEIGTSLASNTTFTVKEPTQAHRVVYGTTRVGGNVVYAETTDNNQFLHLVIAFTGHTITNFSKVFLVKMK